MLNKAISFFPAFRAIGVPNLNCGTVPFPDALAIEKYAQVNKITQGTRSLYTKRDILPILGKRNLYKKGFP